jgi:hypothetical protein
VSDRAAAPLQGAELASRLLSSSLLLDSVARLVSAAIDDSMLAVELAVELEVLLAVAAMPAELAMVTVFAAEAALDALKRLIRAEAELLLTLPTDIMTPIVATVESRLSAKIRGT